MGELVRRFDWSRTPFGPIESWPQSLRTATALMLESSFAMVVAWGPDFRFLYNDRYRPIIGNKHPQSLGSPARAIFPEVWESIIGPLFMRTRQGESVALDDLLIPLHRHGYLENCHFTIAYSPIRDESGGVGGMLAVVAETTERVEGERRLIALRDLARRATGANTAREACANATDVLRENPIDVPFAMLYLLDTEGATAHRVATAGIEAAHAACPETIPLRQESGQADTAWPLDEAARTAGGVVVEDVRARFGVLPSGPFPEPVHTALVLPLSRPGLAFPYGFLIAGVSARRALNDRYRDFFELAAEHVTTAIANARALEEERRRADALAEIDRAKTAFFSNVSHEFRTPLTLMLGPIEELLAQPTGALPEGAVSQLKVTHRNSLRLLKLVNTLLDFSRLEAGRINARYEPVDLPGFTAELAGVFRSAIEKAGLRLQVDCPPLPEPACVDRDMWEKIVFNLLSNALKFTFTGEIAVRVRLNAGQFELTVADTGVGIPETEMPNLFRRFHRIENIRSRTHEGSGIGLALVHELARLHGGEASATSRVGEGSAFTVRIPAGRAHLPEARVGPGRLQPSTRVAAGSFLEEAVRWLPEAPAPSPPVEAQDRAEVPRRPARLGSTPAAPRILLADDNADMRDYVRRLLGVSYAVETVADGEQALTAIRERRPDLVLTDVMMPRLDGVGLLRVLREDSDLRSLPVILLSARAGEDASVEAFDAGADDYLIKPFTARELLSRVTAHLKMARLRQEVSVQADRLRTRERDDILLATLTQDMASVSTEAEIAALATKVVGARLEVERCYLAENDPGANRVRVDHEWRRDSAGSVRGMHPLDRFGTPEWQRAMSTGRLGIDDTATHRLTREFAASYREIGLGAYATAPYSRDGKWVAVIAVGESGPRRWQEAELTFMEDVIARLWPMIERARAAAAVAARTHTLERLYAAATVLSEEHDVEKIVQHVTDAAREISGAAFGAFLSSGPDEPGRSRAAISRFPLPADTTLFEETFRGGGIVRLADVRQDPRQGGPPRPDAASIGQVPVVSYLAVPVKSRSGEVLGGLFFGHPEPDVFSADAESAVAALASQAAIALDNAELYRGLQRELARARDGEASSRRLAAIVESSDDAIISKDLNGIITSWNDGARRLFGYSGDEIVGQSVLKLMPEDRRGEEPAILERLRRSERVSHYETVRQHKDGTLRDVSLSVSPIFDAGGNVVGASKIARDITARRRSDARQHALYEMLVRVNQAADLPSIHEAALSAMLRCFDAHRASILLLDRDGVMRFVAWRGLSSGYRAAVEGHSPWKADERDPRPVTISDVTQEPLEPRLQEVIAAEGIRALAFIPLSYERRLKGKFMLYYDAPHRFEPGELQVAEAIASQIAFAVERQRGAAALESLVAERTQSLRQAVAQMEEFSYSVSHDLRSPVRAMRGYAEAVLQDYGDQLGAQGRELLSRIYRSGLRMDRLIQDLLTYSRISRREVTLEPVPLDPLVREIVQQYPEMKPERATIEIPEALPVVQAHEPSLTQVISNLLSNAVKFVEPGTRPHIRITAEPRPGRVRLSFRDNGIGVPPQYQARLFGMFERLHPDRQYEGTGIGLAIVRKAMERMNGSAGMESDGVNGSRFWIELALAPPPRDPDGSVS